MTWLPFSDAARLKMTQSHQPVSRADILHDGKPTYSLQVAAGKVSVDADRPVRRSMTATLIDPTGVLTEGDVEDLLDPYECEVALWTGVRVAGVDELAPQGVFGLTSRTVSDGAEGLAISIVGQDRTMGYQGPISSTLSINAGTSIEDAIARLLQTRNQGATLAAMNTGFFTGPLLYAPNTDVWRAASELASSVGGSLFHDRTGQCVFALDGPASDTPVRVWEQGDGLLLAVERQEDADTIHNVVIVESTSGLITARVEDTNPSSPTFSRGKYGRRPTDPIISPHIGSVIQAQQAAAARLAYELGRSETVQLEVVPDHALDVQEIVTVHRPAVGLTRRDLVVASFTLPLGPGSMSVGCRKSVLTADGRALPQIDDA